MAVPLTARARAETDGVPVRCYVASAAVSKPNAFVAKIKQQQEIRRRYEEFVGYVKSLRDPTARTASPPTTEDSGTATSSPDRKE